MGWLVPTAHRIYEPRPSQTLAHADSHEPPAAGEQGQAQMAIRWVDVDVDMCQLTITSRIHH